jgi:hypothetical protein
MIKFSFQNADVTLELDVTNAEDHVNHKFIGKKESVDAIKEVLYFSYGMFGHTLSDDSPAIEVNHALFHTNQTDFFKAQLVEGQEIIDAWVYPEIPEGAVT